MNSWASSGFSAFFGMTMASHQMFVPSLGMKKLMSSFSSRMTVASPL